MRSYDFSAILGLSATIPQRKEQEITSLIGEIRRWAWQDLPDEHVPDWYGEVYDAPYPADYQEITNTLDELRLEYEGSRLAGLPTMAERMLCRDGALALQETLEANTTMGEVMGEELLPLLEQSESLHKLPACRAALEEHDFEKAVLFVDRVCIARALETALDEYTTATILGRLRSGTAGQQEALEKARSDDTDLIIATSAGEEGMDLPKADLLIVWSNTVNSVRFIQRLGRIMRKSGINRPKTATYLATPDSPDYEALHRGINAAENAGLDVVGIDGDAILSESIVSRVAEVLAGEPLQRGEIATALRETDNRTEKWLRKNVREGELFYLYDVPGDLDEWRKSAKGFAEAFGVESATSAWTPQPHDGMANNLSPSKEDRFYVRTEDTDIIRSEFSRLIQEDKTPIKVTFGPTKDESGKWSARGDVEAVISEMEAKLEEGDRFYANVSNYSGTYEYTVQMTYNGRVEGVNLQISMKNASTVFSEVARRIS
jgi:hypothetical protein